MTRECPCYLHRVPHIAAFGPCICECDHGEVPGKCDLCQTPTGDRLCWYCDGASKQDREERRVVSLDAARSRRCTCPEPGLFIDAECPQHSGDVPA